MSNSTWRVVRGASLLLLALWACAGAAQIMPCTEKRWDCFGTFEVRLRDNDLQQTIRMIRFRNGEFMIEIEGRGAKKQFLQVSSTGFNLYAGLTEQESTRPGADNPFTFIDLAFAGPGRALIAAYPGGPTTVQHASTQKDVIVDGTPTTVVAALEAAGHVGFRVVMKEKVSLAMEGTWDGELREPLPDNLEIAQWRSDSPAVPATLGEARGRLWKDQVRRK